MLFLSSKLIYQSRSQTLTNTSINARHSLKSLKMQNLMVGYTKTTSYSAMHGHEPKLLTELHESACLLLKGTKQLHLFCMQLPTLQSKLPKVLSKEQRSCQTQLLASSAKSKTALPNLQLARLSNIRRKPKKPDKLSV